MNNPLRWLALVALDEPQLPSTESVVEWLGKAFPDAPTPKAVQSTEALLTFSVDDVTAAATLIPRPIPWSQLEGPCATAWYWPDAAESVREHPAHIMATLIDEGGAATAKAEILTRLVAAFSALSPSCGVFWGPSRTIHPPMAFVDQATQISKQDWPLFIWVDFRVEQLDAGGVRLYTTGLEALGRTEIEVARFDGSPQELLEHAYNFAHYSLTSNKDINDGDTVGLTDELQAVAHRKPSMFDDSMEVVRLEINRDA